MIGSARASLVGERLSHILTVALPGTGISRDQLQKLFDKTYWERFGVELPEIRALLVNIHTSAFAG